MALSGNLSGSVSLNSSRFSFGGTWSATQSISGNYSDLTVQVFWRASDTIYTWDTVGNRDASITVNVDGTNNTDSWSQRFNCDPWPSNPYIIRTYQLRIPHLADGTAPAIKISASANGDAAGYGPGLSKIDETSIYLNKIPRYATASQSLASKTETSITINWSSDSTIDYIWYSTDDGSTWSISGSVNSSSGSYTINDLSANTAYKIKTRVRRKDSQQTTDSDSTDVTTYNFPYATSMPNFTIGNSVTLGFYNPLGRSITVKLYGNNSLISTDSISGTSISGYKDNTSINNLYNSIPNSLIGTYTVEVTYGSSSITKDGGTYSIKTSLCKPSITSVSYEDTNADVVAITENNKNIVTNKSIVNYSASGLVVKNGATIDSVTLEVNSNNYNLSVIGTSASGGNAIISSTSSVIATFTLTDSRGLTATKSVIVNVLGWTNPYAIINIKRHSNFYSETDINVDATYSSVGGKNELTIKYRYKKVTDASYSGYITLQDNVTVTNTFDNEYEWNIQVVLTDKFGTTTYNQTLSRGMPIVYFDMLKSSTGFNCFPNNDEDIEVNGNPVVESGDNGNGFYVKYYDGTLICRMFFRASDFMTTTEDYQTTQNIKVYRSKLVTWNFPMEMQMFPSLVGDIRVGTNGTGFMQLVTESLTSTSVQVRLVGLEPFTSSGAGYTNLNSVYLIAIGRWK